MSGKDPSPEDIARACREIQGEWTAEERLRRLRVDLRPSFRSADGRLLHMHAADYDGHHRSRAGRGD